LSVDHLDISWYHFSPVIVFNDIQISDKTILQYPLASIHQAYVGISLFTLIKTHEIIPNRFILNDASINLPASILDTFKKNTGTSFDIQGLYQQNFRFIAPLKEIGCKNLIVHFIENNQVQQTFYTDLLFNKLSKHYRLQGSFSIEQHRVLSNFVLFLTPNFNDLKASKVKVYLELSSLNLDQLSGFLGKKLPISGNVAQTKLWITYINHALDYLAVETKLNKLNLTTPYFKTIKAIPSLSTSFIYHSKENFTELAINELSFNSNNQGIQGLINATKKNETTKVAIALENVVINAPVLEQYIEFSDPSLQQNLALYAPSLNISALKTVWIFSNHSISHQKTAALLDNLSLHAVHHSPAVSNISVKILSTNTQGKAVLSFHDSMIDLPWLFRKNILIHQGQSVATWYENQGRWQILLPYFDVKLPEGNVKASMNLFLANHIPSRLELMGQVDFAGFTQDIIHAYLPIGIMPNEVVAWLDQALLKIEQGKASLLLRGNMADFPFDQNTGLFLIQGQIDDANLNFYQGWPLLNHVHADLCFKNRKMMVTSKGGVTEGLSIQSLQAEIPSMGEDTIPTRLLVDAKGSGDMAQGLAYIIHSPLGREMTFLRQINTGGALNLGISLIVPLTHTDTLSVQSKGTITVKDGFAGLENTPLSVNQINGKLNFVNSLMTSEGLSAYLGKKPIQVSITPELVTPNQSATAINLSGNFSVADINHYLSLSLPSFISGSTALQAKVIINPADKNTFSLSSSLKGIAINLPAPLGKKISDVTPFSLTMTDLGKTLIQCLLGYNNTLTANLLLQKDKQITLKKGQVSLGVSDSSDLPTDGLRIIAKLTNTELQSWLGFYDKNKTTASVSTHFPLNEFKLILDNFTFIGQNLTNLTVSLIPQANQSQVSIQSDQVIGNITLPKLINSTHPINANFSRLKLSTSNASASKAQTKISPYFNMNFMGSACQLNQLNLGSIAATARVTASGGLNVSNLSLTGANYQMNSNISWTPNTNVTEVTGRVNSNNVLKMLSDFGLSTHLSSNDANAAFSLRWKGFLTDFSPALLEGSANFSIKNGYLESSSKRTSAKIGLGNLITALNIQSLTDRLSRGSNSASYGRFYFQTFQGDFVINNGVWQTKNMVLNGPMAYISVKGKIGLATKTYDLVITIVPNITSSLPVIATIAGGPLAGAATWVIDKAIGSTVNKITKYRYKVQGSWSSPTVTQQSGT
jgi:uncharacterized protein (TIGR02099 family)